MIKMTNIVVANTSEELETLQSLLVPFSLAFNYSIIESDDQEFPFRLLVERDSSITDVPSIDDFLIFLSAKINEANQIV